MEDRLTPLAYHWDESVQIESESCLNSQPACQKMHDQPCVHMLKDVSAVPGLKAPQPGLCRYHPIYAHDKVQRRRHRLRAGPLRCRCGRFFVAARMLA